MDIQSVYDPSFTSFGQVLTGFETGPLLQVMETIPLPDEGVSYLPSIPALEADSLYTLMRDHVYGGMPIQIGMCWGRNTKLNCLEYHRDSEVNIGLGDFILLLAHRKEIEGGRLDTGNVKAFRVPAGIPVEVYATTLHYAPCHLEAETGFRVAVVLPQGTNETKPDIVPINSEDHLLWARNKWLLAHPDSSEAAQGAYIGLGGENIDITAN